MITKATIFSSVRASTALRSTSHSPNLFMEEDQNGEPQDGYVLHEPHSMGSQVLEAKCWHQAELGTVNMTSIACVQPTVR